jgi:hypothetical protein
MTVKASTLTIFSWKASQKAPALALFCRIRRPGTGSALGVVGGPGGAQAFTI